MWYYKGKKIETAPDDMYGFVYIIRCIDKKSPKFGWIYVGKKCFNFSVKKKITKKAKLLSGSRKKTERVARDSGWLNYYGSSIALKIDVKELGTEAFRREILCFCRNKSELSYMELFYQLQYEVLYVPSWNGWISGKIYRSQLNVL